MEEGQKVDVCNETVEKNLFLHVYFVRAQDCYSIANANTLANTANGKFTVWRVTCQCFCSVK